VRSPAFLLALSGLLGACAPVASTAVGMSTQPPASEPSSSAPATPRPTTPPATQAPTTGEVTVPASIDAHGERDVAAELTAFLARVPDGTTIHFQPGTYRLGAGLRILNRHSLVFEGHGATLRATATTGTPRTSPFLLENSSGITIRDFTLTGNNPDAGTPASHHLDRQDQGGVNVYGGGNVLIERTTIRETWGDCVYVGANAGTWSDGVTYRDSACERNGRMGVAIVAGSNVLVARVRFDAISLHVFDIEPDDATGGATTVEITDNTVTTYGLSHELVTYFFAASGATHARIRGVTVTGNHVTDGTLASIADGTNVSDLTFTDNVAERSARGPVLHFQAVSGLVVSGNVQPLSSGELLDLHGAGAGGSFALVGVTALVSVAVAGLLVMFGLRRLRG
jgi:hypothetical protein